MYIPKKDIYKILSELGYPVIQTSQKIFSDLPCLTFEILDNNISLFLDNTISKQDIIVKIDIWSESSTETSRILSEVEEKMRLNYYKMTFSGDIPNVDKTLFHVSTKFIKTI